MGIVSWLQQMGVKAEVAAEKSAVRSGKAPLQWEAGQMQGSLIYRLTRDRDKRASLFATVQTIVVNEGETAVVLEDGRSNGALPPGRYVFDKQRVVGALDIVWLKTSQQPLKWGVGNITSVDNIQISGHGEIYVRIADGVAFNTEVVRGALALAETDLQRLLMPRIQGVLRTQFSAWPALELQTKREVFVSTVENSLGKTFQDMGLGIVGFEVTEVNYPPEFKAVIAQATMAAHAGQARIVDATADAQVMQLEAQAQAQAQLAAGMAQAQVMQQLQATGIDPLKLKALEALQTMAENPGKGGMLTGDAARTQLFGQVAGAALTGAAVQQNQVAGHLPESTMTNQPQQPLATQEAPPAAPPTPAQAETMEQAAPAVDTAAKRAELEEQLDKLVDRLAEGHISEQMYEKLADRIEKRIAALD